MPAPARSAASGSSAGVLPSKEVPATSPTMQSPMPVSPAANNLAVDTGPTTLGAGTEPAPKAPASTDPSSSPVPVSRTPPVPASDAHDPDLYDPMVHTDTSDMLEDSLGVPSDYALLVDIDGII
ncbi:hypothetical protein V6N13_109477 [Hibiscus sabdariffa]|uniref:Uncharacterized protein n=1 Tax=Hibiscus sabdariffa TaxID=183260 RepID=A0ABR2FPQ5_9ROSI